MFRGRGGWLKQASGHGRHLRKTRVSVVEALEARAVLSASAVAAPLTDGTLLSAVVHTPPEGTDKIVYQATRGTHTLTIADFGFSDPGNVPPNNFTSVIISAVPVGGFLTLNGISVPQNMEIPVSQINAGNLTFTLSSSYSTFGFLVKDDGSTADGGMNTATFANIFGLIAEEPVPNFVWNLYHDVLERSPEPRGIVGWLNDMAGGATRTQVATMFWESAEHRGLQVDGFYQEFFNRNPEPSGRSAWVNAMLGGMNEEQVMQAFMLTDEYQLNNPPASAFVVAAYNDVLFRAPIPAARPSG